MSAADPGRRRSPGRGTALRRDRAGRRRPVRSSARHTVGRPRDRTASVDVARPDEVELADDVLPRDAPCSLGVEPDALATDLHPFATAPRSDRAAVGLGRVTTSRSARPRPRDHTGAGRVRLGIVDQPAPSPRTTRASRERVRPIRVASASLPRRRASTTNAHQQRRRPGRTGDGRCHHQGEQRAPRAVSRCAPRRRRRRPPPPRPRPSVTVVTDELGRHHERIPVP